MQITEVHSDPPTEGYDIYIYEHLMPDQMPTDGIVILWDLDKAPNGSGFTLGGIKDYSSTGSGLNLSQKMDSPLLEKVNAGNITVSRFTDIFISDSSYKELLTCDTRPVLLAKDEEDAKYWYCLSVSIIQALRWISLISAGCFIMYSTTGCR